MEPEQDWYRAVLKQVSSESQEVLDFSEPKPELERQDFHLD